MAQPIRSRPVPAYAKNLLWVDCLGGALAGGAVIALSGWLSHLEGLPQEVLLFTGAVNLLYASYSFSLAIRTERPMRRIKLLVVANLAWAPVCLGLVIAFSATATPVAYLHLGGEAVYVAGLAALEWRYREVLRSTV
jgi:membrane-associated PAP2 superfamily phosphatase